MLRRIGNLIGNPPAATCGRSPKRGLARCASRGRIVNPPQVKTTVTRPVCPVPTFGPIIGDRMVNELPAVVRELGGEPVLGRCLRTDSDLQAAIREGLPQRVVEEVMAGAGITLKELAATLDLSARSLQRRRREGRLARTESDRLYRLARIVALAKHYLGDEETATRWLKRPNRALGGPKPLDLIDTELGARRVENVLGRIAYGGVS